MGRTNPREPIESKTHAEGSSGMGWETTPGPARPESHTAVASGMGANHQISTRQSGRWASPPLSHGPDHSQSRNPRGAHLSPKSGRAG